MDENATEVFANQWLAICRSNIVLCPQGWTAKFLWSWWFTAMMIEQTNWSTNQLITHKAVTPGTHSMPIWNLDLSLFQTHLNPCGVSQQEQKALLRVHKKKMWSPLGTACEPLSCDWLDSVQQTVLTMTSLLSRCFSPHSKFLSSWWFTAVMIEQTIWWITKQSFLQHLQWNTFELTWCQPTTKNKVFLNSDTQPQHAKRQAVSWCTHCKTQMECSDSGVCCQQHSWEIQLSGGNSFSCSQNQSTMQEEAHLMLLCTLAGFRVRNGAHAFCWAIFSSSKHALVGWRGNILPCPEWCLHPHRCQGASSHLRWCIKLFSVPDAHLCW